MNLEKENVLLGRIKVDPGILVGKPTIRGYRLSVDHLLKALAGGRTFDELKKDYPFLEPEDIQASLLYASKLLEDERIYTIPV